MPPQSGDQWGSLTSKSVGWGGPSYHPRTWARAPKNSLGQRAMTGKSVEWEGPIDQACTLGRSARRPAWRTVWAGRLELLPKVRAWSIGPPHPTLLPVTALWPNTVFGALAQLEGGKRGLLTQHFFWSNSPTGHQIEEALFFRVSFLPPYRETRLPNGCSRYPRDGKIYVNLSTGEAEWQSIRYKFLSKPWPEPKFLKVSWPPNVLLYNI